MGDITPSTPDERVKGHLRELASLRVKEGPEAYWQRFRELCIEDIWFLIRVPLDWGFLDETLHGLVLNNFYKENALNDTATFIPRGFGKTIWNGARIVQGILTDPNIAIMNVSATDPLAKRFGSMISAILMKNQMLHRAFPDILPSSPSEVDEWGKEGYNLPHRKPRVDPTLWCTSVGSNFTGHHPDWIIGDDFIVRTKLTKKWFEKVEACLDEFIMLNRLGKVDITGTRWADGDPYGKILAGEIYGPQGRYKSLVLSCFEDDDPEKPIIYPAKVRWTMDKISGCTPEYINNQRQPESQGGLGAFFDAQMRNDASPKDKKDLRISEIVRYDVIDEPKQLGAPKVFGIETTGGGRLIVKTLQDLARDLRLSVPVFEMAEDKTKDTKADKIKVTLEPVVNQGRLHAKEWMLTNGEEPGTLGYELNRLGVARNDDIADVLHCVVSQLVKDIYPRENEVPHLYLGADLAWTEEKRSDWTVVMAVAVDWRKHFWVLDYDRFQLSSPVTISHRLIQYYQRWLAPEHTNRLLQRRNAMRLAMSYT